MSAPELDLNEGSSPFVAHEGAFAEVLGADPQLVQVLACDAHEGPTYVACEDALYFTTVPRGEDVAAPGFPEVAIKRLALDGDRFPLERERVSVLRANANAANGMAIDPEGRLIVCEQGTASQPAAITRLDRSTHAPETLVDRCQGLPLNSPNDVVVKSDGTLWFTDPSYGHLHGFKPEPQLAESVYRYDPRTDHLSVVADDFDKPNGLAFSPDERVLYVGDSGANQEAGSYYADRPHHIRAFDVRDGRRLGEDRLLAVTTPGYPDGIKVDSEGRIYASSFAGVQVFSTGGELIGEIKLPGAVNFTFGGVRRDVLFITTDTAIWAAVLNATGPRLPAGNQPKGARHGDDTQTTHHR
ncbi:MAG TPA: SMP-30/gluconolactonase/LRE family protein [Solirubrobacteraceae bacterium]|nr:SMP-30/gluconolactonase/LRE family protein [Solirubrobacteraceae bacterium]